MKKTTGARNDGLTVKSRMWDVILSLTATMESVLEQEHFIAHARPYFFLSPSPSRSLSPESLPSLPALSPQTLLSLSPSPVAISFNRIHSFSSSLPFSPTFTPSPSLSFSLSLSLFLFLLHVHPYPLPLLVHPYPLFPSSSTFHPPFPFSSSSLSPSLSFLHFPLPEKMNKQDV